MHLRDLHFQLNFPFFHGNATGSDDDDGGGGDDGDVDEIIIIQSGLPRCLPAPDGGDTDRRRAGSAGGSGARHRPVEI